MAVSPTPQLPASSAPAASSPNTTPRSTIALVFAQGGSSCLLRPNAIVRGHVELKLVKACYAAGIRVKLRAEESAIVLGQESNGDTVRQKYRQTVITLFDTEVMVSGVDQNDNELANWQEIAPGSHAFPFALKVPNVNFPPCIPTLEGFSIRYVWTAHVDGPFEPSLCSEEVLCQFMPNVLAPKPMEWTFHDTVGAAVAKNSTHQLHKQTTTGIALAIKMHQQIYVPGDPLSMATTLTNNGQNKVVGIDVILRRTIKGTFSTSYANLCNQSQVEIMAKSVECKVRPGESGQVDILTTIPPIGKTCSIPTFESNFLKVYYELLCVVRVKRSVFSGGDTSYQCAIPIPIATHNVDNPMITGRTPRWTKCRMQPYFFEPSWPDPVGDLPMALIQEAHIATNNNTILPGGAGAGNGGVAAVTTSPSETPTGISSPASASAVSLLTTSPGTNSSAMQDFLNSGSAELHRERTLKKSLTRSKSLKDVQSSRLNGSSWRAERDHLLSQSREVGYSSYSKANRSMTDVSQTNSANTVTSPLNTKRSPPLGPKTRSSNEDRHRAASPGGGMDTYGSVVYTPPPPSPSSASTSRPPKSANRDLTPEQQAELAKKASRRILPNQGSYTNEGVLPPELAHTENSYPPIPTNVSNYGDHNVSSSNNNATYQSPSSKAPPRRNASLSQRAHQQLQGNSSSSHNNGTYVADQDTLEAAPRVGGYSSSAPYEFSSSRGRTNNNHNNNSSNNSNADQGYHRSGAGYQQHQNGYSSTYQSSSTQDRIPYQHSLPAHQQPPGVISPTSIATSPPLTASSAAGAATNSPFGSSAQLERSPSRRDGLLMNGNISSAPLSELPTLGRSAAAQGDESGRSHKRSGSGVSGGHSNAHQHGNGNNAITTTSTTNTNTVTVAAGSTAAMTMSTKVIQPWERVERIHHQDWFRPGPHQTGALQTFDVAGIAPSQQQAVSVIKKTLRGTTIDVAQTIDVEEQLR
ncbi:hypothetical protein EDD11_003818 [Mortierella claussenii]|nr:hypothetical protein EDD11_003818 [Mortierella claussenii]